MSLNTSYYRLMLKLKGGPQAVADAAHQAGIATSFPGVAHTLSEDGKGGPPNNGVVLGQYQTRVLDMASAYATLAASGLYHRPHFVQKVVNADGQVLFDAGTSNNNGEQRIDKGVADNVTAAMQPDRRLLQWPQSVRRPAVGGQDRAPPSWATPMPTRTPGWSATRRRCRRPCGWAPSDGDKPLVTASGCRGLRLGLAVGHLEGDHGRCAEGHLQRNLPEADPRSAAMRAFRRRRRSRRHRRRPSFSPPSKSHRALPFRSGRPRLSRSRRRRRAHPRAVRRLTSRLILRRRDRRSAERHYLAGAAGRRSAQRRQPRLPQPHRLFGRRAGRCHRRAGGPTRTDRAYSADDPGAGDVRDRVGIPSVRLVNQGGVPAVHRHRHRR